MSECTPVIPSIIGRLLAELSWAGATIKQYRSGGRGYENVLSAEVLQALDFLPRTAFLGSIVGALNGGGDVARRTFQAEVEAANFLVLPGEMHLQGPDIPKTEIQPDAIITTPSIYCIVEAKRIRSSSFQPKQLAREFVMAHDLAGDRHAMLLLLLSEPPPVRIQGRGKQSIRDAILAELPNVFSEGTATSELADRTSETVHWITWDELTKHVEAATCSVASGNPSIDATISRLAGSIVNAVNWHGNDAEG